MSCFQLTSQGSVATHLRCDGIFSDSIITNFHLSDSEKVWKLVNIWWSYKAYKKCAKFFWAPCMYILTLPIT